MSDSAFDRAWTGDLIRTVEGWATVLNAIGDSVNMVDPRAIQMIAESLTTATKALRMSTGLVGERKAPPCA